ncbi:MAG: diheme cytochrome c [Alphaproteobacteria bacterium]
MRTAITLAVLLAAAAPAALAPAALAEDRVPPITDAATLKECGACHFAFQPAFLPAESWRKIMDSLNDHFGENASLPVDVRFHITDYLVANAAGTGKKRHKKEHETTTGAPLRITETPMWVHEHRKLSEAALAKAGSKVACAACHREAARGVYEDD